MVYLHHSQKLSYDDYYLKTFLRIVKNIQFIMAIGQTI